MILIKLLLAHILTDFVLQPNSWIKHKRQHKGRSLYLIIHALLAGILSYVFLLRIEWWIVPIVISISHYLIDLWKLSTDKDNLKYFLLDQFYHILVILLVWLALINGFDEILPTIKNYINSPKILIISLAYLTVIFPVGYIIGKATQRWHVELESTQLDNSLDAAGRYIGILERILVLTFIITSNFSAIGFLIAAKSILRFSDKSDTGARKQTEYVLIGTLISFTITILIGLLVNYLMFQ